MSRDRCILEGKKLLGRPRRRWEDNIKMDLQEIRLAVCCEYGNGNSASVNYGVFLD